MKRYEEWMRQEGWCREILPFLLFLVWEILSWITVFWQTGGRFLVYSYHQVGERTFYKSVLQDMRFQILTVVGIFLLIQILLVVHSYRHLYCWGRILIPVFTLMQMGMMIQLCTEGRFVKHSILLFTGILLMLLFAVISCAEIGKRGIAVTAAGIFLLMAANLLFGVTINGSRAWILLPVIHMTVQPGEFLKVLDIILVSIGYKEIQSRMWIRRLALVTWVSEIAVLVMVEDLGNALTILILGTGCILAFNIWDTLMWILCLGIAAGTGLTGLAIVSSGVRMRLVRAADRFLMINTVLLDPEAEKNFRRVLLAVVRSGLKGSGFRNGEYAWHMNTMAANSDYAILAVASIFGIAGVAVVLAALVVLLKNADSNRYVHSSSQFISGKLAAIVLALHAGIHIAAATNVGPLTGTTLPFVSDGGSSIWANSMLIGIMLGNCLPEKRRTVWAKRLHCLMDPKVQAIADAGERAGETAGGLAMTAAYMGRRTGDSVTELVHRGAEMLIQAVTIPDEEDKNEKNGYEKERNQEDEKKESQTDCK
ncbi:MAG: FtsW/RodA/SpoVE family cell cycle protein [Lachnospiraceae bacterium]|nr:FtsW/RodA/SpoVE family cell cycle protein [Lachnospiraceae bacterium]